MDRIVEIDIRGERVIGGGVVLGAAGSHDDVKLQMTFDNKWDGLSKKVIFQNANGENSVFVLLGSADTGTTNVWSIYVPAEPKEFEGKMRFGVKGFSVEYRELTAEPTDWATNYKNYYTESEGIYSHVTGDSAPTFSEGTYYECIEAKAVMAARTEFIILPSLTDEDAEAAQEPKPSVAEQLQAGIDDLESGKVDKLEGKGLSTEDYTTEEKSKLSGISSGAQVNVIEKVKVNGTELTPSEKAVNITNIPKAALASDVQTSLGKADTALQTHQDISGKENISNKITEFDMFGGNTDEEYPSAKLVYDELKERDNDIFINIGNIETLQENVSTIQGKIPSEATSSNKLADKAYVASEISTAISTVYKYKGTKTVAEINALSTKATGDVYNVSDSGTITGGISVEAGDNVAWTGTGWDKLAADVDLSNYYTKTQVDTALAGKQATLTFDNSPTENSNNPVKSGGVYASLTGKAAKFQYASTDGVENPVDGQIIQTANGAFWKWNESDTTWERLVVDEISADNIPYDNAISGLAQAYVQGAIDELASEKQDTITFNTAYDASTNKAATMADITTAVGDIESALDSLNDDLEALL